MGNVKIKIKGDNHAVFADRLFKDLTIGNPLKPLVSQVSGIMPILT